MKIHVHILYECTIRLTIKIQEKSKFKLHMKKTVLDDMVWELRFSFETAGTSSRLNGALFHKIKNDASVNERIMYHRFIET